MVLYYIKTVFQLLETMVHKMKYHSQEEAILLTNNYVKELYPNISRMDKIGFSKIIYYKTGDIVDKEETDEVVFIQSIKKYYDELLLQNEIFLEKVNEYYLFASLRFSIYLIEKNIRFNMFEDAAGAATNLNLILYRENIDSIDKKALIEKRHLNDGKCENIKNIYLKMEAQLVKMNISKVVDFDIVKELKQLKKKEIEFLIGFFIKKTENSVTEKQKSSLLLTRPVFPFDQEYSKLQREFYTKIIDYFLEDEKVYIKPHPRDSANYSEAYPSSYCIDRAIPSELLPYFFKNGLNKIISFNSTSGNNLAELCDDIINFGYDYFHSQTILDVLFCSLSIFKEQLVYTNKLYILGVYKDCTQIIFQQLCHLKDVVYWFNISVTKDVLLLVDNIQWGNNPIKKNDFVKYLNKLKGDSLVLFLNTKNDYCFWDETNVDIVSHIIPIKINVVCKKKESSCNKKIYAYCTSSIIEKSIRRICFIKNMKYSNAYLYVRCCNDEEIETERNRLKLKCINQYNKLLSESLGQNNPNNKLTDFYMKQVEKLTSQVDE